MMLYQKVFLDSETSLCEVRGAVIAQNQFSEPFSQNPDPSSCSLLTISVLPLSSS